MASTAHDDKQKKKKTKKNLQKIKPEKLLESLTINVFKEIKGGCRAKLRTCLDGVGKALLYSLSLPLNPNRP